MTRPTTDRVRESLFAQLASWLGVVDEPMDQQLAGCAFLDLYAGSGAVGLEAASRGAETTWVEKQPGAARVIEANLRTLGGHGKVKVMDVRTFLARGPADLASVFDIIWLDPPYDVSNDEVEAVLAMVEHNQWLKPDGRLVVERANRTSAVEFPESFLKVETRRYGDTVIYHGLRGNE